MRGSTALAGLLLGAALLAGCVGSNASEKAGPSTPIPEAPPPAVTVETGSIAGAVTDDELRPIPGATVAVVETAQETKTDQAGAFTFNELAPGPYRVIAQTLGYEQAARKVEVAAGEITKLSFALKPVKIGNESYVQTSTRTALIHAGQSFTYLYTVPVVNQTTVHDLFCNPCSFVLHHPPSPKKILTEPTWPGDTACPNVNCDVWIYYKSTWTNAWYIGDGELAFYAYVDNRAKKFWGDSQVGLLKGKDKVLLALSPSYYGSLEQKVTVYTSFPYGDDFPDDFTALPPP